MATPLFTPGDERQEERLNPGQQDYDRRFNDVSKAEQQGTFAGGDNEKAYSNSSEDSNIKNLQERENVTPENGGWANKVTNEGSVKKTAKFIGRLKKASPLLGIGSIVGVGGFAMLALTSPALLIVQMKEIFTERFNTQLSSAEVRSNKLLMGKLKGTTSGFCSSTTSIRCKYSSMSDKQVNKLKAAGIEIIPQDSTTITGRTKPASLSFKGEVINADQFASMANSNAEFRAALRQAYNPKYAGFTGRAWANVANRFKISKQAPVLNANEGPEEGRAALNQLAREGIDDDVGQTRLIADAADCEGDNCIRQDTADTVNSNAETIERSAADGSAANDVRSTLSTGLTSGTATSIFKITGALDTSCQAYGALTALSYAGKAIRSAQLVRYAMIFLSVADTIKAGKSPDPADVALLGTILTTTTKDSSGKTTLGSATDSFGYKFAAYGDTSASSKSMNVASRFTSGSGFAGEMAGVNATVLGAFGGSRSKAKSTCGTLANPFVQGTSLVLGVAMLFVPGANAAKLATQIAISASVGVAIAVLPAMLADIVSGTVTNDIVGEEAGNAITSGSGALLSDALAGQNGNAPMTKTDAIAYNTLQTETMNRYIADEIRETSPFDASNPHTFIGSIVSNLLPLQSSSNPLTVVGSLLSNSFSTVVPQSKAVAQASYSESLNVCQDLDVLESGYAADPFCNTIRGIPPKYLNKDPQVVADELLSKGLINEDGNPLGEFSSFIKECITAVQPLGYADATTGFDSTAAAKCIINSDNANYYLFYMDQTIDSAFDGYENQGQENATPSAPEAAPTGSAPELANAIITSGNVVDRTSGGQLTQIKDGSRTNVSPEILSVVAALSNSNKFTISSMKRDQALGVGAGNKSLHLIGRAVDFSGSAGVNGVSFGYNGHDLTVQAFLNHAATVLPANCAIGVPNQAYVNATKQHVKPGCNVFIDKGTAPHIHLGIKEGS